MWEIKIVTVGKPKNKAIVEEVERLLGKIRGEWKVLLASAPDSEERNVPARVKKETEALMSRVPAGSDVIALDAGGKEMDSAGFSEALRALKDSGRRPCFLIGGAFGLDRNVLDGCRLRLSLSKMTFSHDLSLLLLVEQIYRAYALYKNIPYAK